MSRWSITVKLYNVESVTGEDGKRSLARVGERKVFANRYTVGLTSWVGGDSKGLHPDSVVNVRASEYHGENRCELEGIEYMVEGASQSGEFTRLILKKRLNNGHV